MTGFLETLWLGLIASLGGCSQAGQGTVRSLQGQIDPKTGKLIACWVTRYHGHEAGRVDEPVTVSEAYSLLIVWNDETKQIFLYDNSHRKIHTSASVDDFIKVVRTLPAGVTVGLLDICCVPRAYAMPRADYDRVMDAVESNGRRTVGSELICTCESQGLKYPASPQ